MLIISKMQKKTLQKHDIEASSGADFPQNAEKEPTETAHSSKVSGAD